MLQAGFTSDGAVFLHLGVLDGGGSRRPLLTALFQPYNRAAILQLPETTIGSVGGKRSLVTSRHDSCL